MSSVNSRRPSVHNRLVTPLFWNGFSAITSLIFGHRLKRIAFSESAIFLQWLCCRSVQTDFSKCKFSIFVMVSHVTTFQHPSWSQTLQTSKRHTFIVLAFYRYHWFEVKLFPVYKIPESVTMAPVLTSTLTVGRRNRGDPSTEVKVTKINSVKQLRSFINQCSPTNAFRHCSITISCRTNAISNAQTMSKHNGCIKSNTIV